MGSGGIREEKQETELYASGTQETGGERGETTYLLCLKIPGVSTALGNSPKDKGKQSGGLVRRGVGGERPETWIDIAK